MNRSEELAELLTLQAKAFALYERSVVELDQAEDAVVRAQEKRGRWRHEFDMHSINIARHTGGVS